MYEYRIKSVKSIIDGDTIDVEIDLGFNIYYVERVRLAGINAPELRSSNKQEKELGLDAKIFLMDLLQDYRSLIIRTEKPDSTEKYGRILGWLFVNNNKESVNHTMIQSGYAWGYGEPKDFNKLLEIRDRDVKK
jgi:micrococcal nuclease